MSRVFFEHAEMKVIHDGTNYKFTNVQSISINDPTTRVMLRSPQGLGGQQIVSTSLNEPISINTTVRNVDTGFFNLLVDLFNNKSIFELMIRDVNSNNRYEFENTCIINSPLNSEISEGESGLDIPIVMSANTYGAKFKNDAT